MSKEISVVLSEKWDSETRLKAIDKLKIHDEILDFIKNYKENEYE